jgi:hypothetical protein
MNLKV